MISRRPVRYAERVERKRKRNKILFYIVLFIVLCGFIRGFALQTWQVRDDLMQPELRKADIVIIVPYVWVGGTTPIGLAGVPKENTIVLVSDGAETILPFWRRAADAVLRFVTFQQFSSLSEFGENFGIPSFMRIQRIVQRQNSLDTVILDSLWPDARQQGTRIFSAQEVSATRILGRVVFRIWPLTRIGLIR